MSKSRVSSFWLRIIGIAMALFALAACTVLGDAAANDTMLQVTMSEGEDAAAEEAKTAPTATPPLPDQHWLLGIGETTSLRCGEMPQEGIPAGQLDIDLNGMDSVAFACEPWEGGSSAAATPGETDQHWQLGHGQKGYALCGGIALGGTPVGQWSFKVNGVDNIEATCTAWEGGQQ